VFTRMLAGPFDFTPGVLSLKGKGGQPFQSTLAKQLPNNTILYAPLQMAADLPENYRRYPAPFQFIKDVPTDWAQTLVPNGEVGDYVTIVRKDRNSEHWYLRSVTDEAPRTPEVRRGCLDAGRSYRAQIYRDGANADFRTHQFAIAIERRSVRRGETL